MNSTITRVFENQIVVISTEEYIRKDLPNIMKHLHQEIDAKAEVKNDTVRIICDLGVKKFEGRALRRLIVREIKRIIREALNIQWHQQLHGQSA
ncbi:hypothetical protein C4544_05315 [candidate division WS5 bacterium]|uniref:Uncharacterized protein n=1 Tax=candidate division WS5 bacterium TaxID=2093353 RepID=A0A419DB28_9BACT|nr:MAG: hypothetical protein C4544_05315 [candidate division WS5 bacterium]